MKTAISIPDEIFRQAEKLARRLSKTRSAIYREAVTEYVSRHDADAVTEAMNRAVERAGGRDEEFVKVASRRILGRTAW